MKRVTVSQVKRAYVKTGLKPIQRAWLQYRKGQMIGCCPLGAIVVSKFGKNPVDEGKDCYEYAVDMLHSKRYIEGFCAGIDKRKCISGEAKDSRRWQTGYRDATAVRQAIFA